MKLYNKIVPIGMLMIMLVSMLGYPLMLIEELDKVTEKVNDAQVQTSVTTDVSLEATNTKSIFKRIDAMVTKVQSLVEEGADEILFQEEYVFLNTNLEAFLGKTVFTDGGTTIVKLDSDVLVFANLEYKDTSQLQSNLINLNEYLEQQGTDLLYVQAPYKISKYDSQLPAGVEDGANDTVDDLLAGIEGYVNYIDIRELMYENGIDHYSSVFKTDHHWLPETGFWAFGQVAQVLNAEYGFEIDEFYTDINNYDITIYEQWFLGSQGKRVGTYLAGVDDFSLITPKFDTAFFYEIPADDISIIGSFEETLIDYTDIEPMDYMNQNTYEAYTGIGTSYPRYITNLDYPEGQKILLVQDSYARCVAPFLALGCSQLDIIDLRVYKEQSLMDYLAEHEGEYDLVLFFYNPSSIINYDDMLTFDEVIS